MPFSMPIGAENPLMQIKGNYIGSLMSVEQARRELTREAWLEKEEEEHISVPKFEQEGKKVSRLNQLFQLWYLPKGKDVPPVSHERKERSQSPPVKEAPKKAKLLSSVVSIHLVLRCRIVYLD